MLWPFVPQPGQFATAHDRITKDVEPRLMDLNARLNQIEHSVQPCCGQWNTCDRACLALAQYWRGEARDAVNYDKQDAKRYRYLRSTYPRLILEMFFDKSAYYDIGKAAESLDKEIDKRLSND